MSEPHSRRHLWVTAGKLCLVALLFAWLIRSGRLEAAPLTKIWLNGVLAAAAAARLFVCILHSLRWRALAAAKGLDVPVREAVKIGFVGRLLDLAIPAGLATDGARAYLGATRNAGRMQDAASSVVMDRFVGAITLSIWAIASALAIPGEGFKTIRLSLVAVGGAVGAAAAAFALAVLTPALPLPRRKLIRNFASALREYQHLRGAVLRSALFSFATQAMILVAAGCAFRAIGETASWTQVSLVQPLLSLTRTVPITPAGLGVVDSAAEALYSMVGNTSGAEMVLVTRGLDLFAAAAGATCLLAPARLREPQEGRREVG